MTQNLGEGIGRRIAAYRKLNGWSAEKLADLAGESLSRATIANIEVGRRADMTLRQFLAICVALEVPPVALLFDIERPGEPTDLPSSLAPDEAQGTRPPNVAEASDWLGARPPLRLGKRIASRARVDDILDLLIQLRVLESMVAPTTTTLGRSALNLFRAGDGENLLPPRAVEEYQRQLLALRARARELGVEAQPSADVGD